MIRRLSFILPLVLFQAADAQVVEPSSALERSVEELRTSIGRWETTTTFLDVDGSVVGIATGVYEFSWVVPDRVVTGRSETPDLQQASAILFYINETKAQIEMVSVGGDGSLWIMTGPLGGDERLSQEFRTVDGGASQLRFTRFNVSPDAFESRMEITSDGGRTWSPGNHQLFRRAARPAP